MKKSAVMLLAPMLFAAVAVLAGERSRAVRSPAQTPAKATPPSHRWYISYQPYIGDRVFSIGYDVATPAGRAAFHDQIDRAFYGTPLDITITTSVAVPPFSPPPFLVIPIPTWGLRYRDSRGEDTATVGFRVYTIDGRAGFHAILDEALDSATSDIIVQRELL